MGNEPVAARAADWIALHGRQIGARAPSVAERAAATGMATYMEALGLTDRETYDAQGNCFHPLALAARSVDPIKQ
eukprot:8316732-Alexandrium_andersonii.AAC.1